MTSAAASNPVSSSTSTKYQRSSSNWASETPVTSAVPTVPARPQLGRADPGGERPVAEEPVVGPPGLHVEAAVHRDELDDLRRDGVLAGGLGVEPEPDAGLPGPLGVLTASSAASSPCSLWPNSSWHSENSATIRPQVRVLLRQLAGQLLGAELGQPPSRRPTSSYSSRRLASAGGDVLVLGARTVAGQARRVGVEVAVVGEHEHPQLGQRVQGAAEHDDPAGVACPGPSGRRPRSCCRRPGW
jgi:hypothetical protein